MRRMGKTVPTSFRGPRCPRACHGRDPVPLTGSRATTQVTGTARQQAARGTYDPAYLNYTLGKLIIRKLRTDWMAANPVPAGVDASSPEKWRAFHDKFLSYGGPPIPLVRREMMQGAPGGEGTLF